MKKIKKTILNANSLLLRLFICIGFLLCYIIEMLSKVFVNLFEEIGIGAHNIEKRLFEWNRKLENEK